MKNLKVVTKVISLFLVLGILMISGFVFAGNEEREEPSMRWSYLDSCANSLEESDDYTNALYIFGRTMTDPGYCADVEVQLQKKSGSSWNNVSGKFWYEYSADKIAMVEVEPLYVNAGTYRLKITHRACDDYGVILETFTAYSRTVTI